MSASNAVRVEQTSRVFEGAYCDEGYEFMEAGAAAGWRAVSAWGSDGWDLGDWPYVVVLFRGELERAVYVEGDITIEAFATSADRESSTDEVAEFYWRAQESGPSDLPAAGEPLPAAYRGPYSRSRGVVAS
jgi:hypothetical protein